jgi:hypothetical protein
MTETFTPPGWALMMFGDIRQRVEDARPPRTLPERVWMDPDTGAFDPWIDGETTVFYPVVDDGAWNAFTEPTVTLSVSPHVAYATPIGDGLVTELGVVVKTSDRPSRRCAEDVTRAGRPSRKRLRRQRKAAKRLRKEMEKAAR